MTLVDVTYTAFWVPLGVAFCTEGYGNIAHSCTAVDLAGGGSGCSRASCGRAATPIARHVHASPCCATGVQLRRQATATRGPALLMLRLRHGLRPPCARRHRLLPEPAQRLPVRLRHHT